MTAPTTVCCPNCKGRGQLLCGTPPDGLYEADCDNCDGTGKIGPDSMFYEWALGYWQERGQ